VTQARLDTANSVPKIKTEKKGKKKENHGLEHVGFNEMIFFVY
jgi:hypothetical protein